LTWKAGTNRGRGVIELAFFSQFAGKSRFDPDFQKLAT